MQMGPWLTSLPPRGLAAWLNERLQETLMEYLGIWVRKPVRNNE